ncbi:MAG: Nif3-like dinuclear metal center hexameric protein [Thermoguttaceae bacterium]
MLSEIISYFNEIFPNELAESWDNVGLLVGDPAKTVRKIMTCLTVTPETVSEAAENKADLIVSHHPFPFHATKRITTETVPGQMLLKLVESKIAVYSPHTTHDNVDFGVNKQLADMLELHDVKPLVLEAGRFGLLPQPMLFNELVKKVKTALSLRHIQFVDSSGGNAVRTVAIGCGAAGGFLENAIAEKADVFLLGETSFHTCLEAKANGVSLIMPGHFASERFAMEKLAVRIQERFPNISCFPSRTETDPISVG